MKNKKITANQATEGKYYAYGDRAQGHMVVTAKFTPEDGGYWYWAVVGYAEDDNTVDIGWHGQDVDYHAIEKDVLAID